MKYDPERTPKVVCECLRRGTSIKKTCNKLGIAEPTFYEWMHTKPEFSKMVNETKQMISDDMDEAMLKLAKGGIANETTRELRGGKMMIVKKVTKKVLPDLKSIMYYKNNIDPKQWQDKKSVDVSGEVDVKHSIPAEVQEILNEIKHDKS
jgi:hypothetical protein